MGSPTPAPSSTPDLTQIPLAPIQEAQKNSNTAYQIGDRINLLAEIRSTAVENGEHLSLKIPDGGSKLEDQGWYLDPSTQFLTGTFRFIASPIQTGTLTLPTLLIVKDDQTIVARTSPFTAKVAEIDKKQQAAPELIDITESTLAAKYWIILSLVTLLLVGLVTYFLYSWLKKRRNKPKDLPKARIEADDFIALRKIESLYQKHSYSVENLKPVAFGLSEALKEFFSHRFKIDATEATTDEMLALLRKEAMSPDSIQEIQNLFQDLDLIKFTRSEHYRYFDEMKFQDFKVKSQLIVQKWTLRTHSEGPSP